MKDRKGKGILGGAKIRTPSGKIGYVYQTRQGEVRVTKKPQTGLIGWFKPKDLEVIKRKKALKRNVKREEKIKW
jgi:hypothetical protein|tara:strand:+ start:673 stop:894 length:222 start_codon:yes stop_codon:yes gene_type:complete